MRKPRWLPECGPQSLEALWERFPAACQRGVVLQYARLIERAVRPSKSHAQGEERDEPSKR